MDELVNIFILIAETREILSTSPTGSSQFHTESFVSKLGTSFLGPIIRTTGGMIFADKNYRNYKFD